MHICYICNEYPPVPHGGIGSFTQTLGRKLVDRGHQVSVVGLYSSSRIKTSYEENDHGVHVIRLAILRVPTISWLINDFRLRQALMRIHEQHKIDVLDGHEPSLAFIPKSLPIKKVIRMQGGHYFFSHTLNKTPKTFRSWRERNSFSKADSFCAVSKYVAIENHRLLKMKNHLIEILPNPIDVDFFKPNPLIPVEEGLIIFVGTLVEKKGVRELVQAMFKVIEAVPGAHLWLFGRDTVDPITGESFQVSVENEIPLSLKDRILFKGRIENSKLPDILARAQICTYPSHMESQGIAWIEGMAMGKPVVASNTGPGSEIIQDGLSGLLCNPHDPASIAMQLIKLLEDNQLRQYLSEKARQRAVENFSVDLLVHKNVEFYERILSPTP